MKDRRMMYAIVGLAVVLGAVVLRILLIGTPGAKPAPSAPGYYTGLMKSKGSDTYATEEGKVGQPSQSASTPNTPPGGKSSDTGKTSEE